MSGKRSQKCTSSFDILPSPKPKRKIKASRVIFVAPMVVISTAHLFTTVGMLLLIMIVKWFFKYNLYYLYSKNCWSYQMWVGQQRSNNWILWWCKVKRSEFRKVKLNTWTESFRYIRLGNLKAFSIAKATLHSQMLSVCYQNPSTAWNHHPSSFFIHPSFNLHNSSFIIPSFRDF